MPSSSWRLDSPPDHRVPSPLLALAALAGSLGVAVLLTLPLAWWFDSRCWGARFDFFTNLWFCWYLKHLVELGQFPGRVDMLLYPVGEDFFFAYGHCFVELLSVPFQYLWSLTVSYNLLSILALGLSGFTGFLLCLHVTGSRSAAWIGGLFFECNSYLYSELVAGSVEVAFACWLPLYLLLLLRTLESARWRDLLLAALALFVTAGSNWLYGIMACLATALVALWETARRRSPDPLVRSALVVLLFLVAMSPYLARMFEHVPVRRALDVAEMTRAAAPFARSMDGYSPLSEYDFEGRRGFESLEVYLNSARLPDFLTQGLVLSPHESAPAPLLWSLALLGAVLGGRRILPWAVLAGLSFTMSLGPFLRTNDLPPLDSLQTSIRLPFYYLYNHAPLFSMIYRPYRFHVLTVLAMAVLAAVAWTFLRSRVPSGRAGALAVFAAALLLSNLLALQPLWSGSRDALPLAATEVPSWYEALAREPGDFAIMDLPFYARPLSLNQSRYVYYQAVHHKKILSTVFIRPDTLERFLELYRTNSMIRWLVDSGEGRFTGERVRARDVDWLLEQGYRYAVLHREFDVPVVNLVNGSERKQAFDVRHRLGLVRLFGPPEDFPGGLQVFDLRRFRQIHAGVQEVDPVREEVRALADGAPMVVQPLYGPRVDLPLGNLEGLESVSFWLSPGALRQRETLPVRLLLRGAREPLARLTLHPDRYDFVQVALPPGSAPHLEVEVDGDGVGADLVVSRPQGLVAGAAATPRGQTPGAAGRTSP